MPAVTLLQYEICPFCSKVKGLLDFYRVPYRTLEVNPLTKHQLLSTDLRAKRVPLAIFPEGSRVSDSPLILRSLWDRKLFPTKTVSDTEWAKWETFVDKRLAVLLFPNITRNFPESWQAFSYVNSAPRFSTSEKFLNQTIGSVAMRLANSRLKKKYDISDERASLLQCLNEWTASLKGVVHGKDIPDEVDAMVFGVLRSIEGLEAHSWILSNAGGKFSDWYTCMTSHVGLRHSQRLEIL